MSDTTGWTPTGAGVMRLYAPRQIQDSMDRNMALNDTGAPEVMG